jgi:hypothetical protein
MRMTWPFRAILIHGGFPVRPLIRFATISLAEPRGHRPSLKFAKDSVRHRPKLDLVVLGGAQNAQLAGAAVLPDGCLQAG